MSLWVWVVEEQIHAHVLVGFSFEPINKFIGRVIYPNSYLNRAKTHQISGSGYPLPSIAWRTRGGAAAELRKSAWACVIDVQTVRAARLTRGTTRI
jgi:hypothetical protein